MTNIHNETYLSKVDEAKIEACEKAIQTLLLNLEADIDRQVHIVNVDTHNFSTLRTSIITVPERDRHY